MTPHPSYSTDCTRLIRHTCSYTLSSVSYTLTSVCTPPPLLNLYVTPALLETKQQLTGKGRVSAMLCSPVSSHVNK